MARTRRKKKHTHDIHPQAAAEKVPKSFVISRGKLPRLLRQLQLDIRSLMLPHTALNLKEKRKNGLKDFVSVAAPLGVTHFLIISKTEEAAYLRVARCPHGPTLTFKIHDYSLVADIARSQARPGTSSAVFKTPPLIVLAGLGSEEQHLKLTAVMFQNIFPVIDVNTVKLSSCHRIVLLNYNKETKLIDFRHYAINLQPVGVTRKIRKIVQNRQIPDLRGLDDVSEFITKPNYGSESEAEDEAATVKLVKDCGRVNRASSQSAVKLHEIGPRMTLQLVKVEEGLCSGGIIFHEFVKKTPEEIKMLRESIEQREALRKQRKAEQEANVRRKELEKQALNQRSNPAKESTPATQATMDGEGEGQIDNNDIDDAEWYRQEVGEEPDSEFMAGISRTQERAKREGQGKQPGKSNTETYSEKQGKFGKNKHSTKTNTKMSNTETASETQGKFRKNKHSGTTNTKVASKKRPGNSIAHKILSEKRKGTEKYARTNKRRKGN